MKLEKPFLMTHVIFKKVANIESEEILIQISLMKSNFMI